MPVLNREGNLQSEGCLVVYSLISEDFEDEHDAVSWATEHTISLLISNQDN